MRDQKPGIAKDLRTGGDASVGTVSIDTGYFSSLVETAGAAVRTVGKVDSVSLISNLGDGTELLLTGKSAVTVYRFCTCKVPGEIQERVALAVV